MTIKVMIVDDSAVMRQTLSAVLNAAPDIQVIQTASDPIIAERFLKTQSPDVLVLDIEMPRMDGLTFLQHIMQRAPLPVVICSSLTSKGCELSLQALSAGAVEIITKPTTGLTQFLQGAQTTFWQAVRIASQARLHPRNSTPINTTAAILGDDLIKASGTTDHVVAIGTSTGGTQALEQVLAALPRTAPGIVVVQHMPEKFTSAFAKRLNSISAIEVLEAQGGERIIPGRALIAPGGHHLEVQRSGAQFITRVFRGPAVNRHCPSVDVLFNSVAKNVGRSATGIIMTGMGNDGARGLLNIRESGGNTIAQDKDSSVVFGMPKEAIDIGAAKLVISLDDIAQALIQHHH